MVPRFDPYPMPNEDADPFAWLLFRQQLVISRRQALRHLSPKAIRARLASGRWRTAVAGVYLTHTGPVLRGQRYWIAVLAASPEPDLHVSPAQRRSGRVRLAVLAGESALTSCGLRGFISDVVHVLIPDTSSLRRPPSDVRVHRTSHLPERDLHEAGCPPRTAAARSLVDAAQWAGSDLHARAVVAACFQQRLVTAEEVIGVLDRMPRAHRRALVRETALDAAGGAHSLPEAEFLRLCRRAGLPTPSRQVRRRDARGRWRYLDAFFEPWGVHVEIDGSHHVEVRQWWADMRRQNDLWIVGQRVLRFPSWVVRHRPGEVAEQVRAALIAAGWRPERR